MYLTAAQSRTLSRLFGLLAEDLAEEEVRTRIGYGLLELLQADYFASFVWDDVAHQFGRQVSIGMRDDTLANYRAYYQFHDPITFALQQRRVPTLVTQIMPQAALMRTEFFNDFLARDGLHWGVNLFSYTGIDNLGDLRIWRGSHRENFDAHTLSLLRLIEPAFTGALQRARLRLHQATIAVGTAHHQRLSPREHEVAQMVGEGLTDKHIAQRLSVELSTVRTYLNRIFDKLGTHRRSGIAARVSD